MSEPTSADLAGLYRETRQRLADVLSGLAAGQLAAQVPACPGWSVRDVVAHLAATCQDVVSGRLTGLPTDQYTADQIARLADVPVPELLDRWAAAAPAFEQIIATSRSWPAVIDVASHEQDVRGAIGRPGARDCAAIKHAAEQLLAGLRVPVPLRVVTEDGEYVAGADDGAGAAELTLGTSRFEAFRWRMGRRSRAQLAALRWSGDPIAVLDHLTIFGPAVSDIVE